MTAKQFKEAREAKGMNQRELAVFLGASYSAVTKWESNANPIPKWVQEKLVPLQSLLVTELTAEELAEFERKSAERGKSPDGVTADLIRHYIKFFVWIGVTGVPRMTTTAKLFSDAAHRMVG